MIRRDKGSRLRVAGLRYEPLLCLFLDVIWMCVGGRNCMTLRLLHCFVVALKTLLFHLLCLLEELNFSRVINDDAALVVLVESVLRLLLVLIGYFLRKL